MNKRKNLSLMKIIILGIVSIVLAGCTSIQIVHSYNPDDIKRYKKEMTAIPTNLEIGHFTYLPKSKVPQDEFDMIGVFYDSGRKIDTNISVIVENELQRFAKFYIQKQESDTKCILNGDIYYLGWDTKHGGIGSVINYSLTSNGEVVSKLEINHVWQHGSFSIRTVPQKLTYSIHGNFFELLNNTNFREEIRQHCR